MKRLLKWLVSLLLILVVAIGLLFVHVWYFKPAKLDWFYTRVFAKFAVSNPEMLSSMRILSALVLATVAQGCIVIPAALPPAKASIGAGAALGNPLPQEDGTPLTESEVILPGRIGLAIQSVAPEQHRRPVPPIPDPLHRAPPPRCATLPPPRLISKYLPRRAGACRPICYPL